MAQANVKLERSLTPAYHNAKAAWAQHSQEPDSCASDLTPGPDLSANDPPPQEYMPRSHPPVSRAPTSPLSVPPSSQHEGHAGPNGSQPRLHLPPMERYPLTSSHATSAAGYSSRPPSGASSGQNRDPASFSRIVSQACSRYAEGADLPQTQANTNYNPEDAAALDNDMPRSGSNSFPLGVGTPRGMPGAPRGGFGHGFSAEDENGDSFLQTPCGPRMDMDIHMDEFDEGDPEFAGYMDQGYGGTGVPRGSLPDLGMDPVMPFRKETHQRSPAHSDHNGSLMSWPLLHSGEDEWPATPESGNVGNSRPYGSGDGGLGYDSAHMYLHSDDEDGERSGGETQGRGGHSGEGGSGNGTHNGEGKGAKGGATKKKHRVRKSTRGEGKVRPRFTPEQANALESAFQEDRNLSSQRKVKLANQLGVQARQVSIWFQNRRARWRYKQAGQQAEDMTSKFAVAHDRCSRLEQSLGRLQDNHDAVLKQNAELRSQLAKLLNCLKRRANSHVQESRESKRVRTGEAHDNAAPELQDEDLPIARGSAGTPRTDGRSSDSIANYSAGAENSPQAATPEAPCGAYPYPRRTTSPPQGARVCPVSTAVENEEGDMIFVEDSSQGSKRNLSGGERESHGGAGSGTSMVGAVAAHQPRAPVEKPVQQRKSGSTGSRAPHAGEGEEMHMHMPDGRIRVRNPSQAEGAPRGPDSPLSNSGSSPSSAHTCNLGHSKGTPGRSTPATGGCSPGTEHERGPPLAYSSRTPLLRDPPNAAPPHQGYAAVGPTPGAVPEAHHVDSRMTRGRSMNGVDLGLSLGSKGRGRSAPETQTQQGALDPQQGYQSTDRIYAGAPLHGRQGGRLTPPDPLVQEAPLPFAVASVEVEPSPGTGSSGIAQSLGTPASGVPGQHGVSYEAAPTPGEDGAPSPGSSSSGVALSQTQGDRMPPQPGMDNTLGGILREGQYMSEGNASATAKHNCITPLGPHHQALPQGQDKRTPAADVVREMPDQDHSRDGLSAEELPRGDSVRRHLHLEGPPRPDGTQQGYGEQPRSREEGYGPAYLPQGYGSPLQHQLAPGREGAQAGRPEHQRPKQDDLNLCSFLPLESRDQPQGGSRGAPSYVGMQSPPRSQGSAGGERSPSAGSRSPFSLPFDLDQRCDLPLSSPRGEVNGPAMARFPGTGGEGVAHSVGGSPPKDISPDTWNSLPCLQSPPSGVPRAVISSPPRPSPSAAPEGRYPVAGAVGGYSGRQYSVGEYQQHRTQEHGHYLGGPPHGPGQANESEAPGAQENRGSRSQEGLGSVLNGQYPGQGGNSPPGPCRSSFSGQVYSEDSRGYCAQARGGFYNPEQTVYVYGEEGTTSPRRLEEGMDMLSPRGEQDKDKDLSFIKLLLWS